MPNRQRVSLALSLALALLHGAALATGSGAIEPIQERLRFVYYPVTGNSIAEIRQSLLRSPLRSPEGRVAYGLTDASFGFQAAPADMEGQGCRFIPPYRITLDLVVTLPRLASPSRLTEDEMARWRRYERELREHELIHVADARVTAAELRDWLEGYRHPTGCPDIGVAADEFMDQLAADNRARAMRIDGSSTGVAGIR